ncbi:MAG: hypothetical protein E7388_01125 [Ruminococcaceae bacterium]|nr:hypothetical protein [Oscillospiraceae bacterium]
MLKKIIIFNLVLLFFILHFTFLFPGFYLNILSLNLEENRAIKGIILDAVKDRCSVLFDYEKSEIYDESASDEIIQFDELAKIKKGYLCVIDMGFMINTEKKDNKTYYVVVKSYYPENVYYHFEVQNKDGTYLITQYLLDV